MKKISVLILTTFVFNLFSATSFAFSDVTDATQDEAVDYLEDEGIISGYPDGTFKPNNSINRAELMKILVGAANASPDPSKYRNCFPDVKTEWFSPYVCYAKSQGWISGYPDGTFKPAQSVNRAEAMKMLINSQDFSVPGAVSQDVFTDVKAGTWYSPFVYVAKAEDIVMQETGNYYPANSMTRGDLSVFAFRALTNDESEDTSNDDDSDEDEDEDDDNSDDDNQNNPPDDNDEDPVTQPPVVDNPSMDSDLTLWANEGGDKVTQDELRATRSPSSVKNSVWDGDSIQIFGAKNEVVNFNLIIEAPDQKLSDLKVEFNKLTGPSTISTNTSELFDWTQKNIELFYVRYLEIKGLSAFMGIGYDQRHLPKKLRTTHDEIGNPTGDWYDRPNHNKFYPEIAVPLELEQGFNIATNKNQSIWVDIYIPKNKHAGIYQGEIKITQENDLAATIPVTLEVYDFTLPDSPNSKTMLSLGYGDINERYFGERWPNGKDSEIQKLRDQHFKLAHRHKISLIDNDGHPTEDRPADQWLPRLSGDLFTAKNGYDGPGVGTGNDVFSIGHYGSWDWKDEGKAGMQAHTDNWESWFQKNFPNVERFLYLIDESDNYAEIETWAKWINEGTGPGKNLKSLATTWVRSAFDKMPSLDIPTSGMYVADKEPTQTAIDHYVSRSDKKVFFYNGGRPGQGSFMTDDDGVALRELAWGQYKKKIDRWFYWESTYYNNFQAGEGQTNVFKTAKTFGGSDSFDTLTGESGWNYSNGDGVLFYPGTDKIFPAESYDVMGPIASLRLKYWRRGIQDVDYLVLAAQKDPLKTAQIVAKIVPKVLWEYDVADAGDPTWVRTEISWSDDPDVWEQARRELAEIIR